MSKTFHSYEITDFRKDFSFSIDDEGYLVIKILDRVFYEKPDEVNKCAMEATIDHSERIGCEGCLLTIETPDTCYRIDIPFRDILDVATACMSIVHTCRLKRN